MKLLVDGRVLAHRVVTGVERYASEFIRELGKKGVKFDTAVPGSGSGKAQHLWEHLVLPFKAKKYDLLFCPANISPFVKACKTVTTIHSLAFAEFPAAYSDAFRKYYGFAVPMAINLSDRIITVSHCEADRIVLRFPKAKNKTAVVYPGVSGDFKFNPEMGKKEYIIFPGGMNPIKNLQGALEAFGMISGEVPHKLIVIGTRSPLFKEGGTAGNAGIPRSRIEFRGWLGRNALIDLYQSSSLMVFPSFYESFGFPPLEAMACGLPGVVSNAGGLPEICGDAVIYTDPHNAESIAEGMLKVLKNDDLRKELIDRGLGRARLFGWEKSVERHLRVFEEVFLSPGRAK